MPFVNLNDKHFTAEEQNNIINTLQLLETALTPKLATLTADERITYGSVAEQNKLVINKVRDLRNCQTSLSSPDVDWEEFEKDFQSRTFLQSLMMRLDNLQVGLNSSKILHDWDNYQASLTDYDYTKYKESTGAHGYQAKALEIRQFFSGRPSGFSAIKKAEE
ncbi:hypothetical protein D3C80_1213670 [compost metagenome]